MSEDYRRRLRDLEAGMSEADFSPEERKRHRLIAHVFYSDIVDPVVIHNNHEELNRIKVQVTNMWRVFGPFYTVFTSWRLFAVAIGLAFALGGQNFITEVLLPNLAVTVK